MNANRFSGIWVPGLVVLLTGTYAYWAAQRELVSSRPTIPSQYEVPDPVPTPGVRTVYSRMWEDPLSTAYVDFKRVREAEAENNLQPSISPTDEQSKFSTIPDENPTWWKRLFEPSNIGAPINRREKMQEFFRSLIDDKNFSTVCLPVFVPGGPYADDKEKRMRIRYAVVTALAESGYSLLYNERMSYVSTQVYVRTLRAWELREIVVPCKLYRHDGSGPQVQVLWINESELGLRPLLATHRILNEIFAKVTRSELLDIAIIGPSSSGTLKNMASELTTDEKYPGTNHWKLKSYLPDEKMEGCTPIVPKLLAEKSEVASSRTIPIFSPRATMVGSTIDENPYFRLYRVIGNDEQLAIALKDELKLRGVLNGDESKPRDIVLITEHDTAYGRGIQSTFEKVFDKETISTFKVLRGIDGILPGDAKESPKSPKKRGTAGGEAEVVERQPEGRSQYDYLKRLAERIRTELPEKPAAIGVVSSDVYDKLLVLRALKPQFPDSVFFTTDLDAIYSHPDERQHTRNLIVASHFGLSLGSVLQQETAPFRDSYQTATFLATRLAIFADKIELDQATRLEITTDELKNAAQGDEHITDLAEDIRLESAKIRMAAYLKHPEQFGLIAARIEEKLGKLTSVLKGRKELVEHQEELVENFTQPASILKQEPYHSAKICIDDNLAIQSIATELKEACLWQSVLSRLGDDPDKAAIAPVIHVVGQKGTQQLTYFKSDGKDGLAVEAMVHVSPSPGVSGWHISFIAVVTVGAVLCVLLLTLRDQFRESLLLCFNWAVVEQSWASKVRAWQKGLNIAMLSMLSIGLLLIIALVLNAWSGNDIAAPFDGFTTWTRNVLYAVTGIVALVLIAYLLDRFIVVLNQARHERENGKICEEAWETFQMSDIAKAIALSVVVVQAGSLFVCGFNSWCTLVSSTAGLGVLGFAAWYYRKPQAGELNRNLILSPSPQRAVWWGMGVMIVMTGVTALLPAVPSGWHPDSTSRNAITRLGDGMTKTYVLVMVGMLLTSMLFCYLWCVEYSRYAKESITSQFPGALQLDSEYDRLWLIGKLTSVVGRLTPAVMGLLLVLVIAYHPLVSPAPMPMGLLVLISIAFGVFLGPSLLVWWHFNGEREQVLGELHNQQSKIEMSEKTDPSLNDRSEELSEDANVSSEDNSESELALVSSAGELVANDGADHQRTSSAQPQRNRQSQPTATEAKESRKQKLEHCKQQILALSEGVYKPWAQSPMGWIFGGGASLAIIDLWVRWWTYGL